MKVCSVVAGQCLTHAFEAVCDGNAHVVADSGLHVVEHLHPELGTLGVLNPDAKNVAGGRCQLS